MPRQKALISKRAAEHGVVDSYHRFYLDLAFEIVLCVDPLPTSADSLQTTKILPRISFFSTIHEIITPRKICAIRLDN